MCAVAINQCTSAERPAPCDKNADCVATGPAQFLCSCRRGYEGDGFVCSPVDPCQLDDGRCPVASTRCVYLGPGQVGAAAAGRGRGEGGRRGREGGTLQGAAFEGRKFGILAFALQCVSVSFYLFSIYSVH